MSAKKPHISQLQKYLNGELDARAMHELERQALDDPFLQEALQGYEATGKDQQHHINALQKRLQQRTKPERKRIALWPAISIAASILLFISVGGWWLLNYRAPSNKPDALPADNTEVAKINPVPPAAPQQFKQKEQPVIKPAAPAQRYTAPEANGIMSEQTVPNAPVSAAPKEEAKYFRPNIYDSLKKANHLNEVLVVGYGSQRKSSITGSVSSVKSDSIKAKSIDQTLAGRLAGVQIGGDPGASQQIRIRGMSSVSKAPSNDTLKIITGQILSGNDKQPLPGVSVRSGTSGLAVVTDARGRFKIPATNKDELNIGYLGYESQKVKVGGKDSLSVLLKENTSALSEMVVVGYGSREPQEVTKEAHPATGWSKFYEYLDKEARIADGKTGVVRVSFVVNTNGGLTDFKILKSLNPEADMEAIEIIKDGANWIPNVNGKPETVKIRVRFRKEQ